MISMPLYNVKACKGQAGDLVHDISGEVCVAESDDAILDEAPALVEVLSGADLLLEAGG